MSRQDGKGEVVAKNLIKTYGFDRFARLMNMLTNHISGSYIALEFNVSRQRVWQWKKQLGVEQRAYYLHPAVENLLSGQLRHLKI